MDPMPELPQVALPAPNDAGVVVLDQATLAKLYALISITGSYLRTQLERCGKEALDAGLR